MQQLNKVCFKWAILALDTKYYELGYLFIIPTMAPAEESCHVKYKGRKASYFCMRLPGCMHSHAVQQL